MRLLRLLKSALVVSVVVALAAGGYLTREAWLPLLRPGGPAGPDESAAGSDSAGPAAKVIVSAQAQKNLGLSAARLKARSVWRTVEVPGLVVDRPGRSDRNLVAPAAGVVASVRRVPGDAVRPGDLLFTLRLTSESLHQTQSDLFRAGQDITLTQAQRKRLMSAGGAVPEARVIEADNQIARLRAAVKAHRRELSNRGLTARQIDGAAGGEFVSEIDVAVPAAAPAAPAKAAPAFEVQELKVELGQQVQAGQTLCVLADHQALAVEGRAFRDDMPALARSFESGWPVEADLGQDGAGWGEFTQPLAVSHIANTIDPLSRTFAFLLPLENESRAVERAEGTRLLWRFRPGQQARLRVRAEEVKNVFVLPPDAVAGEGPEAFVFTQNADTFERRPVRVVLRERERAVIDNDGSLETYAKGGETWTIPAVALTAAAQLNRMARAGSVGVPKGYHVHADGSLHKNHDEGK